MYNKEEAKQLRLDFWAGFGVYSKSLPELKPNKGRWILYYTKIKNLELKFEIDRHVIRVMIELNHKSEDKRLLVYEQLYNYKNIIESEYGGELIWDYVYTNSSGNEVCRIYNQREGYDFHNPNHWPEMYRYMASEMLKIEKAFKEVKDFIQIPT